MDRRASVSSQNSYSPLQQLDPSPISSPELEKALPDLPSSATLARSANLLGLSGGGHGSIYYLTRLQRYSSYVFTVYASFHITNTSIIPLLTGSVAASEPYLLLTRPYYQSFPLESLLITLPIATHILSGVAIRIHRRNANIARYGASSLSISTRLAKGVRVWPTVSWSSLSGYILTPLVLVHAFTNRILPYIYEGGSSSVGLGFVSHGFAKHPALAWTGYVALVGLASGHFVWGISRWNGWVLSGSDRKAKRRWWTINGASVGLAILWMTGGLGIVARGGKATGWIGKDYDLLYSRIPLMKL